MRILQLTFALLLFITGYGQEYQIGFQTLKLMDSSRTYKPGTSSNHPLHFRPVELDIWYPSRQKGGEPMSFGDLFELFEERAVLYQEEEDYSGMTEELAQYYVAELGVGTNGTQLLNIGTESHPDLIPLDSKNPLDSGSPMVLYMAGTEKPGAYNHCSFRNPK